MAITYKIYLSGAMLFLTQLLNAKVSQPNIILILADDMGYSDIGCYGSEIATPNVDQLAKQGVRFTQFYNSARCCPTRASLLTGLYPHQTGLGGMTGNATGLPGYNGEITDQCVTIAEVLHSAGYKNYMAGKWHIARSSDGSDKHNWPIQRGFDRFFGTITGGGNYFDPNGLMRDNDFIKPGKGFYYTDQIGDNISSFINDHVKQSPDKPFFAYVAFTSPHWPLHATDSVMKKYRGKYECGWDVIRQDRFERMKKMGIINSNATISPRNPDSPEWESVENRTWESRKMEVYASQVHQMDQNIGKILATLKNNGMLENTLIFFLSDNGGCAEELGESWKGFLKKLSGKTIADNGDSIIFCNTLKVIPGGENSFQSCGLPWANVQNTPYRMFKHFTNEGGIRTPFIISWPNGLKSKNYIQTEYTGHIIDIMATCVAVSGAKYPKILNNKPIIPFEGRNLLPIANNEGSDNERILCWEHEGNKAIRIGNWKLVCTGEKNWSLYNLFEDPTELNDIASANPEKVKQMSDLWNNWAWRVHVLPHKNYKKSSL